MNNPNRPFYNRPGQFPVQKMVQNPHVLFQQVPYQQVNTQPQQQLLQEVTHRRQISPHRKQASQSASDRNKTTYLPSEIDEAYHNSLEQVVTTLLYASGFDYFEKGALETLLTVFHSYLMKLGEQTRLACEISGRTIPTPSDTWFALINIGHPVSELPAFLDKVFNQQNVPIYTPLTTNSSEKPRVFKIGDPRPHPAYVYEWMPPLADPHTYIKTEVSNEPDLTYEKVREAIAQKKRNGVVSLVNYMIRSYPRLCLFSPFERIIFETVQKSIDEESEKKRFEEAFQTFKQLVGDQEIDGDAINARVLFKKGLISEQELEDGVEVACLCKDGTLIDVNGKILPVKNDVQIEFEPTTEEKKIAGPKNPGELTLDCLMTEMEQLECFTGEDKSDEMKEIQQKYALEYLPEWAYVLEPSPEHRSYLQSLLTDLKLDDETKKEGKDELKTEQREESDENVADNPYFRPPRITRSRNSLSS